MIQIGNRSVIDLVGLTFRQPAAAAQYLMTLGYPRQVLWLLVVLVSVLSVLVMALTQVLIPAQVGEQQIPITPMTYAAIVGLSLVILVFAVHMVGQVMGGKGRFDDALALMIWVQFMAIPIQIAQAVVLMIAPALVGFVTMAGLGFLVYCLAHFVTQLHRFDSIARGVMTLVVAILGMVFGLAMILTLIGVSTTTGAL